MLRSSLVDAGLRIAFTTQHELSMLASMKATNSVMGRRPKLNRRIQKKIVSALAAGNYTTVAVGYAGIARATFYRWMLRGREAQQGPYRDFYQCVRQAMATAEVRGVAIVRQHMATSWKACMAWLERRHPQRWRRRRRQDVENTDPRQILRELQGLSEVEFDMMFGT